MMTAADTIDRLLQEAIAALDRADEQPLDQLVEQGGTALRAVVRLRNALLETHRGEPTPERASTQITLDATNAALSCVSGVAYPGNRLTRDGLRQARAALSRVRAS
jgi:hypothetical protein